MNYADLEAAYYYGVERGKERCEEQILNAKEHLIRGCKMYDEWYLTGKSCDAPNVVYDLFGYVRLALQELEGEHEL